ncbi:MAG: hydroxyphenylacetyl-CoA thioesterase PaaI [Paracoccus sp. (in: a-proteobacteria)]|nr:hydroxyphenylacetyl-CoA thioesterase PaaI [Paracoccus sp. (in: a-proteobacteria)]
MDNLDLARACAEAMWADDPASQHLGMTLDSVEPGRAVLTMEITPKMVNGHGIAHGGYIFALADSAFAFACNTYDQRTVGHQASITYLAPARAGDRLTATATERARQTRSGLYDVTVTNQTGTHIAEFRGHSRTVKGRLLGD